MAKPERQRPRRQREHSHVADATALSGVRSADVSVGSQPFGAVTAADGQLSFVTLANAVAVLSNGSSLTPTLDRVLSAPGATGSEQLTNDGKYLLVGANSGALVFSVADAEQALQVEHDQVGAIFQRDEREPEHAALTGS